MSRPEKREISMTTCDLTMIRTESAFDVTCCCCDRNGEAREIEIKLPKALGRQPPVTWYRPPEGWWLQDAVMDLVLTCPECAETPLSAPVKPDE